MATTYLANLHYVVKFHYSLIEGKESYGKGLDGKKMDIPRLVQPFNPSFLHRCCPHGVHFMQAEDPFTFSASKISPLTAHHGQ